jgi:hypothetical protein
MKIRPTVVDYRQLKLNAEQGFVLSRVDGPMSLHDLVTLTGFSPAQVQDIVVHLVASGAVAVEDPQSSLPPGPPPQRSRPPQHELEAAARVLEPEPEPDTLPGLASPSFVDQDEVLPELTEADEVRELTEADEVPADEPEPMDDEEASVLAEETRNERAWRRIYDAVYRPMDRDRRMAEARLVEGANLMALCLDPEPQMVFALQENPRFGLGEARFIAFHHRTQSGLELLTRNAEIVKDSLVQRRLLRNPQLPDPLLRKIVHGKMLGDTYKIAIDREVPERTRVNTAELLRRKFMLAGGDEKAALVIKTEARCLLLLTNCAFDAQTTQILCGRTGWTMLCIQNLVRWSATPPQLLRALLKLPIIRQNVGMRKLLLKHPNMPSDVKRAFNTGQPL